MYLLKLAEETSWRPHGVKCVSKPYSFNTFLFILTILATDTSGRVSVHHSSGGLITHFLYDKNVGEIGIFSKHILNSEKYYIILYSFNW